MSTGDYGGKIPLFLTLFEPVLGISGAFGLQPYARRLRIRGIIPRNPPYQYTFGG